LQVREELDGKLSRRELPLCPLDEIYVSGSRRTIDEVGEELGKLVPCSAPSDKVLNDRLNNMIKDIEDERFVLRKYVPTRRWNDVSGRSLLNIGEEPLVETPGFVDRKQYMRGKKIHDGVKREVGKRDLLNKQKDLIDSVTPLTEQHPNTLENVSRELNDIDAIIEQMMESDEDKKIRSVNTLKNIVVKRTTGKTTSSQPLIYVPIEEKKLKLDLPKLKRQFASSSLLNPVDLNAAKKRNIVLNRRGRDTVSSKIRAERDKEARFLERGMAKLKVQAREFQRKLKHSELQANSVLTGAYAERFAVLLKMDVETLVLRFGLALISILDSRSFAGIFAAIAKFAHDYSLLQRVADYENFINFLSTSWTQVEEQSSFEVASEMFLKFKANPALGFIQGSKLWNASVELFETLCLNASLLPVEVGKVILQLKTFKGESFAGFDVLKKGWSFLQLLFEKGWAFYATGDWKVLFEAKDNLVGLHEDISNLELAFRGLVASKCGVNGLEDMSKRVESVHERVKALVYISASNPHPVILRDYDRVKILRNQIAVQRSISKRSYTPFAMLFHGSTTVGKTALNTLTHAILGSILGYSIGDEWMFTFRNGRNFDDGLGSYHWHAFMDEMAATIPDGLKTEELERVLNLINPVRYMSHQAALENKGVVTANFMFVSGTTNNKGLNVDKLMVNKEAVLKRMLAVEVIPLPEFATDNRLDPLKIQVAADKAKSEGKRIPTWFWYLRVEKYGRYKDGSLGYTHVATFTDEVTYTTWLKEQVTKHFLFEEAALITQKSVLGEPRCSKCACVVIDHVEGVCPIPVSIMERKYPLIKTNFEQQSFNETIYSDKIITLGIMNVLGQLFVIPFIVRYSLVFIDMVANWLCRQAIRKERVDILHAFLLVLIVFLVIVNFSLVISQTFVVVTYMNNWQVIGGSLYFIFYSWPHIEYLRNRLSWRRFVRFERQANVEYIYTSLVLLFVWLIIKLSKDLIKIITENGKILIDRAYLRIATLYSTFIFDLETRVKGVVASGEIEKIVAKTMQDFDAQQLTKSLMKGALEGVCEVTNEQTRASRDFAKSVVQDGLNSVSRLPIEVVHALEQNKKKVVFAVSVFGIGVGVSSAFTRKFEEQKEMVPRPDNPPFVQIYRETPRVQMPADAPHKGTTQEDLLTLLGKALYKIKIKTPFQVSSGHAILIGGKRGICPKHFAPDCSMVEIAFTYGLRGCGLVTDQFYQATCVQSKTSDLMMFEIAGLAPATPIIKHFKDLPVNSRDFAYASGIYLYYHESSLASVTDYFTLNSEVLAPEGCFGGVEGVKAVKSDGGVCPGFKGMCGAPCLASKQGVDGAGGYYVYGFHTQKAQDPISLIPPKYGPPYCYSPRILRQDLIDLGAMLDSITPGFSSGVTVS